MTSSPTSMNAAMQLGLDIWSVSFEATSRAVGCKAQVASHCVRKHATAGGILNRSGFEIKKLRGDAPIHDEAQAQASSHPHAAMPEARRAFTNSTGRCEPTRKRLPLWSSNWMPWSPLTL